MKAWINAGSFGWHGSVDSSEAMLDVSRDFRPVEDGAFYFDAYGHLVAQKDTQTSVARALFDETTVMGRIESSHHASRIGFMTELQRTRNSTSPCALRLGACAKRPTSLAEILPKL